jgi:hypothetical protein
MKVDAATGAVYVDKALCAPANPLCTQQCVKNCRKGGYPKVATSNPGPGLYAYKCNLCYDQANGPACVNTCPGKALSYDTVTNIKAKLNATGLNGYSNTGDVWVGEGHMFWARKSPGSGALGTFNPPTTDPYIEDHISPMFNKVLKSPVGAALAVPALLLGGLFAFFKRRETLSEVNEA